MGKKKQLAQVLAATSNKKARVAPVPIKKLTNKTFLVSRNI